MKNSYIFTLILFIGPEMVRRIDKFLKAPEKFEIIPVSIFPDGSPIGMDCMN